MRKLTNKTWYSIDDDHATIYAVRKSDGKKVAAFICHPSCIPVIERAGSLQVENVVLRPVKQP